MRIRADVELHVEIEPCPYLRPAAGELATTPPYAVYCRFPDGRIRVPSRDEVTRFCASGHNLDCPGYRRAHLRETFMTGVA